MLGARSKPWLLTGILTFTAVPRQRSLSTHSGLKFQPRPSQLAGAITEVDEQITRPFEPRVMAT